MHHLIKHRPGGQRINQEQIDLTCKGKKTQTRTNSINLRELKHNQEQIDSTNDGNTKAKANCLHLQR